MMNYTSKLKTDKEARGELSHGVFGQDPEQRKVWAADPGEEERQASCNVLLRRLTEEI